MFRKRVCWSSTSPLSRGKGIWGDKGRWVIFPVSLSSGFLPVEDSPEGRVGSLFQRLDGRKTTVWTQVSHIKDLCKPSEACKVMYTCPKRDSAFGPHPWGHGEWATTNKERIPRIILSFSSSVILRLEQCSRGRMGKELTGGLNLPLSFTFCRSELRNESKMGLALSLK